MCRIIFISKASTSTYSEPCPLAGGAASASSGGCFSVVSNGDDLLESLGLLLSAVLQFAGLTSGFIQPPFRKPNDAKQQSNVYLLRSKLELFQLRDLTFLSRLLLLSFIHSS